MTETIETRRRRLWMRSIRRGIKEMDIILTRFAEKALENMDESQLDAYEAVLDENDQDLYQWVSGQKESPQDLAPMIAEIAAIGAVGPTGK